MDVSFLVQGERLIRVHRFRFLKAQGCAQAGLDIVVEEALGETAAEPGERCTARPDHPRLVPKAQYTVHEETVEAALRLCVERIRPRPLAEVFLPAS
jgi:hypothetical protein